MPRPSLITPRSWPLTAKVPLLSAAMIFAVALLTTQVALRWSAERETDILARMGAIYLDGISGALLPYAAAADRNALAAALDRSQQFYSGLPDRFIAVRWSDPGGDTQEVRAGETGLTRPAGRMWTVDSDGRAGDAPVALMKYVDSAAALMWVFRRVPLDTGGAMEVMAALDLAAVQAERRLAQRVALLVDLALAALAALGGYALTRRLVRPLGDLTARLESGAVAGGSIPAGDLAPASTEFGKLQRGINSWLSAERHRADLQAHVAEQEKMMLLGKLAAGLAHEVRNPLAGLLNALSTLRRFGDDPAVRAQTADLLERGLHSIARVADAALSTYREPVRERELAAADIDDLRVLVAPAVKRRALRLHWHADPLPPARVDTSRLRQILLNLLLNACAAARPGGEVRFSQRTEAGRVVFEVGDDGPGLPSDVLRLLTQGDGHSGTPPAGTGLGLWITLRLADDLGAKLAVTTAPGQGTRIQLALAARACDAAVPLDGAQA